MLVSGLHHRARLLQQVKELPEVEVLLRRGHIH